jgi:hypothetical protein
VLGVGVNMTNSSIRLYQSTFDISNYWVLGGTLRNCATNVTEMYFTSNNFNQGTQTNTVSTSHAVGTFNLPGGSTICSAINLSGVISHLDLTVNSTTVWTLDNAIVDASTLNYSSLVDTELLNLVKVFVSADQDEKVDAKIFWADDTGAVTTDAIVSIGNGLNGYHPLYIKNDYTNSNGDIYFSSEDSTYTIVLTFKKVRGFYSSKAKPWSA